MKVKHTNFKVAVFAVAAIALGSTGIYTINNITTPNNTTRQGVYAAEAKRIEDVVATGNIQILEQNSTSIKTTSQLDISIADPSKIESGDYIEIDFDNLTAEILNGREIRFNDVIVGRIQRVSGSDINLGRDMTTGNRQNVESMNVSELILRDSKWKLVFNDQASKFTNMKISIDVTNTFNYLVYADRPIDFTHSISVNGRRVVEEGSRSKGLPDRIEPQNSIYFSRFYANSIDGEEVNGLFFDFGFQTKGGADGLKPGDIVEMTLPDDSGVAFDSSRNPKNGEITRVYTQELWANYGNNVARNGVLLRDGTPLKYKVLENSSHKLRYQIVEIADTPSLYQFLPRLTILDTSPKTINYEGQALNNLTGESKILRDSNEVVSSTRTANGSIDGARLKAYGQIKKRGSVIVKYVDELDNPLMEEILLHNKVQEGTKYSAEKKSFKGFEFKKMGEGSAPQDGVVKEGVQNVILVYKISAQNITIKIGDTPDPKSHIPDFDKNFPGCKVKYKETPDTSKSGTIDTTLIISCPDQPDREVDVQIIVEEEPKQETPQTPQAPNTGSQSANLLPTILAGLSTISILAAILFKKK